MFVFERTTRIKFKKFSIPWSFYTFNISFSPNNTQFHFSKSNTVSISILFVSISLSSIFSIYIAEMTSELLCILSLLIGISTFDLKMVRYYLVSFDFLYKLFNWTLYMFADIIWNDIHSEMSTLRWTCYALKGMIFTMMILYISCIDAYQIPHRYKVRALIVLVGLIGYFQICTLLQVYSFNLGKAWSDTEVVIPILKISISLRSLMLNSLNNFILFIGKQLVLMLLHPNKAIMPIYPKIYLIE